MQQEEGGILEIFTFYPEQMMRYKGSQDWQCWDENACVDFAFKLKIGLLIAE